MNDEANKIAFNKALFNAKGCCSLLVTDWEPGMCKLCPVVFGSNQCRGPASGIMLSANKYLRYTLKGRP